MNLRQTPDAKSIALFLAALKQETWLGTARRWWPDYVFHFTDVQNAVSILTEGALFSRAEVERQGLMLTDNASHDVIGHTDARWKEYVRLYFRPKTPTQFHNEGFKPAHRRTLHSHCPVPIYFLFDSKSVLSRIDSQFTDGNLASRVANVYSSSSDLARLPFRRIYHDKGEWNNRQIVFNQNAEVIIPRRMGLEALRSIVCRSQAEYETLLALLPESVVKQWKDRTGIGNRMNLFFKRWVHVESVDLDSASGSFQFRRNPQYDGPFHAKASFTDTLSDNRFVWENKSFMPNGTFTLDLSRIGPLWDYSVRLTLDDDIAYAGRYQGIDLPW